MSKDIRSFFTVKKTKQPPALSDIKESPVLKRKGRPLSSDDDDDVVPKTPTDKREARTKTVQKKRRIIESDDEEEPPAKTNKKPNLKKLSEFEPKNKEKKKEVDVSAIFGSEPVRVDRKKIKNGTDKSALMDDGLDSTLINLNENILFEKPKTPKKKLSPFKSEQSPKKSPTKSSPDKLQKTIEVFVLKSPTKNDKTPQKSEQTKTKSETKTGKISPESKIFKKEKSALGEFGNQFVCTTKKEATVTEEGSSNQKPKKREPSSPEKKSDLETSVLSDEDRFEKRRIQSVLYQKFKNRQAVLNPGSKEVPEGKPNCLAGLSFLVTGILESLEREEAQSLIKSLGGKVSSTVGKRLNYMVVGEEAGPKKLVTAEELGIKVISEDGLFDLIREKSKKGSAAPKENGGTATTSKKSTKMNDCPVPSKKEKIEESPTVKKERFASPKAEGSKSIKKETLLSSPKVQKEMKLGKKIKDEPPGLGEQKISIVDAESLPWVDKYKPTSTKQIIGQQGAASCCAKLLKWLSNWHSNHDGKKKLQRPNPYAKNDDGSYFKAALLSGPPGVGKTTTASLVCKELGFDAVEFNASDTRSKKLLKVEVAELLSNQSLYGYFHGANEALSKKHVLVMDEVDGMAGNEDRGGIQELISLIKDSSVPIICMCNDRNHQKMRSLVNYCFDLRFNKPRVEQIKGGVMSILFKEGMKLSPTKLEEIIAATNNDIRQTLNHLSLISAKKDIPTSDNVAENNTAKKDLKFGPWEVVRKVFSIDEHKHMTLYDKCDLFFHDYSLGPLFVQQNYLMVSPSVPRPDVARQVARAANSLSLGDLIDKRIRSNSAWSLLPMQAMFSSVMPGEYMAGHFTGQIAFPGWLGKNSKSTKRSRLAQEIHDHTRVRTSGSRLSIRLDYAPFLLSAIINPLKKKGTDGVEDALQVIKEYRLLREDIESLVELTSWPGKKNPMESVDSKVKAALTRLYNKEILPYSYSANAAIKKKRAESLDGDEIALGSSEEYTDSQKTLTTSDNDEEDDTLENDVLIKAKKKPTASTSSSSQRGTAKKTSTAKGAKSKK